MGQILMVQSDEELSDLDLSRKRCLGDTPRLNPLIKTSCAGLSAIQHNATTAEGHEIKSTRDARQGPNQHSFVGLASGATRANAALACTNGTLVK
jgi:hypothetical protein